MELKQNDFPKVVEQAGYRMPYADYTYTVIELSLKSILNTNSFARAFCYAIRSGIGVITYEKYIHEDPTLWLKAKYSRRIGLNLYTGEGSEP